MCLHYGILKLVRDALGAITDVVVNSTIDKNLDSWLPWKEHIACYELASDIIGKGVTHAVAKLIEGTCDGHQPRKQSYQPPFRPYAKSCPCAAFGVDTNAMCSPCCFSMSWLLPLCRREGKPVLPILVLGDGARTGYSKLAGKELPGADKPKGS